jgi:glycosyltransferase involved in cell wall biosynthesis
MAQPVILTLLDFYVPGFKGGGPSQSVAGLVRELASDFDFRVLTRDRDKGDGRPFPGIAAGAWQRFGGAEVLYVTERELSPVGVRRIIRDTPHDVLYLNSLFSPRMAVVPLLLRKARLIPVHTLVVAPRGQLHAGALAIKRAKKLSFLRTARTAHLLADANWHATSDDEAATIERFFPGSRIHVAQNLVGAAGNSARLVSRPVPKLKGSARVVFLSRIARKKNLHGALEMLRDLKGAITLHIYGPIEDESYWRRCSDVIESLPRDVCVEYCGPVEHKNVQDVLATYDVLMLPTMGENYGHVIVEALGAGCPVLISDQTPWTNLECAKAGWELPLRDRKAFTYALQRIVDMSDQELTEWRQGARSYLRQVIRKTNAVEQSRQLFASAVSSGDRPS